MSRLPVQEAGWTPPDRNPRSCDGCQIRKVRCRRDSELIIVDNNASQACINCSKWAEPCTFLRSRRRRGTQGARLSSLEEEQRRRTRKSRTGEAGPSTLPHHRSAETYTGDIQPIEGLDMPMVPDGHSRSSPKAVGPVGLHASQAFSVTDGLRVQTPAPDFDIFAFLRDDVPFITETDPTSSNHRPTRLDDILSRQSALRILNLYFSHVYGIIPIVHKPSFLASFYAKEDEHSPMFLALVFAMIATSLVHVPTAFVPDLDMYSLSSACVNACEEILWRHRARPDIEYVCIKYLVLVIHMKHGEAGIKSSINGELVGLSVDLGLHLESTYQGMDCIVAERGRRAWCLIHNATMFDAVDRGVPILFRSDTFRSSHNTSLPKELDDEYITSQGYLPKQVDVPIVAGLNVLTKTVTVLGDILSEGASFTHQRPSSSEQVLNLLKKVRDHSAVITSITADLQSIFVAHKADGAFHLSPGWEDEIGNEAGPPVEEATRTSVANVFLVLKANIHVTLAVTRLRLILYRDALLDCYGPPGHPDRAVAQMMSAELGQTIDTRTSVCQGLLGVLRSIPLQALIINGPSLVSKLRIVASTLLDATPPQPPGSEGPDEQPQLVYLLDFLNVLTNIERQAPDQTLSNPL